MTAAAIKKSGGFTMIEVMVVLALMILLVGISVPAVSNITHSQASSELGRFNSFLKKMFAKSIRKNEYIRVVINIDSGEYWAEKTETPFFVMTGEESAEAATQNKNMLEDMEEAEQSSDSKNKNLSAANTLFDLLKNKDSTADPDLYNWQNFVPDKRSIKQLLKPDFTIVSEKRKIPKSLQWTAFFSYHTPQIITPENAGEEKVMAIYIFPQGKIEPFFLAIGEAGEEGETYFHIKSDFYMATKIARGGFGEEVKDIQKMFEEKEEEGK